MKSLCNVSAQCGVILLFLLSCVYPASAQEDLQQARTSLWVGSQKNLFSMTGDQMTIKVDQGSHSIFYNGKLSFPYTLQFTDPPKDGKNNIIIKFNLAPDMSSHPDGFMGGLLISGSGYAFKLQHNTSNSIEGVKPDNLSRKWKVTVNRDQALVYLNDKQVEQYDFSQGGGGGLQGIPFISILTDNNWWYNDPAQVDGKRVLNDLKVISGGSARQVNIYQQPRIIYPDAYVTFLISEGLQEPSFEERQNIALLNKEVVRLADDPDLLLDPVVVAMPPSQPCCWNASPTGWLFIHDNKLRGDSLVLAHELSHNLGCALGKCYDRESFAWLWEGYTSYLGQRAMSAYQGDPLWHFDIALSLPYGYPKEWVAGGINDPPLGLNLNAVPKKYGGRQAADNAAYFKGYTLFQYFSEKFQHTAISRMVTWSRSQDEQHGELFFHRLSRHAGMPPEQVEVFKPGWFNSGAYNDFKPSDALDSDGDKLADFQETILGTDPSKKDTDGDGFDDYHERAYGSNPLDNNDWLDVQGISKNRIAPFGTGRSGIEAPFFRWILDGDPADFPTQDAVIVQGKSGIEKIALQTAGEWIIGALWHQPMSKPATMTRMVIQDDANNAFEGTYQWDKVLQHTWFGGGYPQLPAERIRTRCTAKGCEFMIPNDLFQGAKRQVGIMRASRNKGIDTQVAIEASFREDTGGKIAPDNTKPSVFSPGFRLDPIWQNPRVTNAFGGRWVLDGNPEDIPSFGSTTMRLQQKHKRGGRSRASAQSGQTGDIAPFRQFMMQYDVTHFIGGLWNNDGNLPDGKNEHYELVLEDKDKNTMKVVWKNGRTQSVSFTGKGTGWEKEYSKEDYLLTCIAKGCEFYVPLVYFNMGELEFRINAEFSRVRKVGNKEERAAAPLWYEFTSFKISEETKKKIKKEMEERNKLMEERGKKFKKQYGVPDDPNKLLKIREG